MENSTFTNDDNVSQVSKRIFTSTEGRHVVVVDFMPRKKEDTTEGKICLK